MERVIIGMRTLNKYHKTYPDKKTTHEDNLYQHVSFPERCNPNIQNERLTSHGSTHTYHSCDIPKEDRAAIKRILENKVFRTALSILEPSQKLTTLLQTQKLTFETDIIRNFRRSRKHGAISIRLQLDLMLILYHQYEFVRKLLYDPPGFLTHMIYTNLLDGT